MSVKQRILIISDTHRQFQYLERLHETIGKVDLILHLGDVARDQDYIQALFECDVDMVEGNNDFFSGLPGEFTLRIGKHLAFLTHGHGYSVYNGTDRILRRAKALGADIAMFGHTHCPLMEPREGVMLMNPGSISSPRQQGREHTYIWMEVDENGEYKADIRVVE